jgi:hypothetical protein
MPTLTIEYRDEHERLALEQALAYLTDLRQVADTAADGTVLDTCERVVLDKGRALLRSTLAAALQGRLEAAEQKGGRRASAHRRIRDARAASTRGPL